MSKGVQRIFSEAARTYEMINHLLTFGLDILLRRKAAHIASAVGGLRWLDVCSGTGEMAASLNHVAKDNTQIVSSDFSIDMLRQAKEKPAFDTIMQTLADSGALPFKDDMFDLITISYATRNLNPTQAQLTKYLKEFRRVLKPGGIFINLETSQPSSRIIRFLYHLYIRVAVRRLGEMISGSRTGYAYLSYTIPRFYNVLEFAKLIKMAGFSDIKYLRFFLGIFAIHQATKT
ncbi:MAG: ubiquinone/menaquinone biosynthesis methyltransferase [Candidatus Thorarchaeota archaeon]